MDELPTYELKDLHRLVREVAAQVSLDEDTAWLALVHRPSTTQTLLRVDPLPVPALLDDDDDISSHLRAAVESFELGWRRGVGPEHMAVTIIVRPGFTVFGPNEAVWLRGWRYSNHMQSIFTSAMVLVTEHGWLEFMSHVAGAEPRMVRSAA